MSEQARSLAIIPHRLYTHRLVGHSFPTPAAAVAHFGAVQAQDYLYSLWALGLRVAGATEASVEQAIADRQLVRTWPFRGTIHYVTAADARWMVRLTAERTLRSAARRLRQLELDDDAFARSRRVIIDTLQANGQVSRPALLKILDAAGVSTAGQRGYHILWYHAHEGLICIGPRQGRQQTFVLVDEWLPPAKELSRDEALAQLARRYFTSHGPATLADFTWWSGLTTSKARSGLAIVDKELAREEIEGQTYWFAPRETDTADVASPAAHLLPVYDEYMVAYRDRRAVLPVEIAARPDAGNGIFRAPILLDGRMAGTWTRKLKKGRVIVSANLFRPLAADERDALGTAADRYGKFLGLAAELD